MNILKRIFRNWLVQGRWILMFSVILSMALAAITFFQKQPKKFEARIYGCTSLLNFQSMFDYFGPVVNSMKNNQKDITAKYLNVKESELKFVDAIILDHINQVVEEADIRYEFTIITIFREDTTGSYKVGDALVNFIKNNSFLVTKSAQKKKALNDNKQILQNEVKRVDSILNSFKDRNTAYYETLRQRRVDLMLQLNQYLEKHNEFYDVKVFYGFDKTGQWVADESKWIKMLVYYLSASFLITFLFAIFRDKSIIRDVKNGLSKSGVI
ncbi:MAG: hypothetical protein ACO3EE_03615 [Flavobacteriales bacterium]